MDLENPKWMYAKAGMFVFIGLCCFTILFIETPTARNALLLLLMIWAFSRAYYFMFYVIEKYVDSKYRFSGIVSFLKWAFSKRTDKGCD